jgi:hypothetical protein
MRPLGLDLPSPSNLRQAAIQRAQANLMALTHRKAAQARREAVRAHRSTAAKVQRQQGGRKG